MEKGVLISLGDSKMKDVAEVLASKSAVKILDLLGEETLTVTEVASRLKMKLNTVDYNIKKLKKAGLIEKADSWWSVKGRKMVGYKVVDKSIVISPKRNLVAKKFLWVLGMTGILGIWLRWRENAGFFGGGSDMVANVKTAQDAAVFGAMEESAVVSAVPRVAETLPEATSFWASLAGWEWFLFGAWTAIVLFFVYSMVVERKR
jgi:DNA-binding transcriptional ArsR family regulator